MHMHLIKDFHNLRKLDRIKGQRDPGLWCLQDKEFKQGVSGSFVHAGTKQDLCPPKLLITDSPNVDPLWTQQKPHELAPIQLGCNSGGNPNS